MIAAAAPLKGAKIDTPAELYVLQANALRLLLDGRLGAVDALAIGTLAGSLLTHSKHRPTAPFAGLGVAVANAQGNYHRG